MDMEMYVCLMFITVAKVWLILWFYNYCIPLLRKMGARGIAYMPRML